MLAIARTAIYRLCQPTGVRLCDATVRAAGGDSVDRSRYPELQEDELQEKFVLGSGPGGQSVNKTANAVALKHVPTGLTVKCHDTRSLETNRRLARQRLADKLDHLLNGVDSVAAQLERLSDRRSRRRADQQRRRSLRKQQWKEREGVT